jgi:predicted Holliday junction resolvase-like endonuclease
MNWSDIAAEVSVFAAIVGVLIALVKQLIRLTATITTLNISVVQTKENLESLTTKNTSSHERIWKEFDKREAETKEQREKLDDELSDKQKQLDGCRQDINNHETRLQIIEHKK